MATNTVTLSTKATKLLTKAKRIERKSESAVIENALSDFLLRRERWARIRIWGAMSARKKGIKEMAQVVRVVDEVRR